MSDTVIKAESLGKKYVIGHQAENGRYVALRDVLMHNVRSMWHKTKDLVHGDAIVQGDSHEEVWALRDINFKIHQGDVVGIFCGYDSTEGLAFISPGAKAQRFLAEWDAGIGATP